MRSTKAIINLSNLRKNYLAIRKKVNNKKIMAVVKADAYGHGMRRIVEALNKLKNKPEYYAVALIEEGIELRKSGIKQPILIFDTVTKENAPYFFSHNLIPTVFTKTDIDNLTSAGKKWFKIKKQFKIHVKVDTGMNRLGIKFLQAFNLIKQLSSNNKFIIDGIYTHFATSDEYGNSFAKLQLKRFNKLLEKLKKNKINYGLVHAANSGAIINMPDSYFDMVRPGISLYGYYPSLDTCESIELLPVMSLVSQVASLKQIQKGETVSYGRKFKAKKTTEIASASLGYADGFSRNLTNKSRVIINNKFYKQVGTVTMDRIMFDVGNGNVKIGYEVVLIGKKGDLEISAWDWCHVLNTIPYEVTCNISKRVPRVYKY